VNPRHSNRWCTEVWNINKCLPEGPPEAIPAAAAAQKAMQANITTLNLILGTFLLQKIMKT
jgi:hypothetical protein